MARMDEPLHNYVVTRGDTLRFVLRVAADGAPLDFDGYAAEIVVRLKGGGTIALLSPERITLVAPGDLADADAPNLIAALTPEETLELTADHARHLYQVRLTEPDGGKVTVLKGAIDARYAAAEEG